jgi:signal transduction histidine kinase
MLTRVRTHLTRYDPPGRARSLASRIRITNHLRSGLLRKYLLVFLGLVSAALILNAIVSFYFSYHGQIAMLKGFYREKAEAEAGRVSAFFSEIRDQIGWTTYLGWDQQSVEQRRFDYLRLLRQVPAISEISQLNDSGREQLKVSRLDLDVRESGKDYSRDARFTETLRRKVWFSPVYFRLGSEPYLRIAIERSGGHPGVTVAEVNLKLIWDVVRSIRVGHSGVAYIVDGNGRLIAHPDISLVLRNTEVGRMPFIAAGLQAMREEAAAVSDAAVTVNIEGRRVLAARSALPSLHWLVLLELPMSEALLPLYSSALHSLLVLIAGLALAGFAAMLVVGRMLGPLRELQSGAALIGAGLLDARINVRSGDELELLAREFNAMADQLQQYNARLERTVEERTADLARSVSELHALADVVRAVNSTLDEQVVLSKIVTHAVELANADAGAIFGYDPAVERYKLVQSSGLNSPFVDELHSLCVSRLETADQATAPRQPMQLPDLTEVPLKPLREASTATGFHSVLVVPLIGANAILGSLVLVRRIKGTFTSSVVDLMSTFAGQSALAMRNAALFRALEGKTQELQSASEHKSRFLANMSHELRTPLNAILGYTELLVDGVYGELETQPRGVLERVQENGRNLLALINDVLDLAKIEAGQLSLHFEPYRLEMLIGKVIEAMSPLASRKGLSLNVMLEAGIPMGYGDPLRLRQVLVNLIENAIKFTDAGDVSLEAKPMAGLFRIDVRDTGPGIAAEDQDRIFGQFQQAQTLSAAHKGGTGLGLAISREIILMHGGSLSVVSRPGFGSTFRMEIPIRAGEDKQ